MTNRIFWMTAATAVLLSCNHAAEEDFREELPKDALTSIDAYFAEAPLVKTSYAIGDTDAVFSWSDNDNIDVSVYSSADDISSYVVFKRVDGGVDDTTVDDSNRATSFTDGQDGNRTFKSLGANYVMDKWAFYPSHVDQTAQQGGYAPDWSIENDKLYMDLPSSVTVPLANPLAVVPMVGKKDGEGKYAFTQLTGVLAFTIDGLPDGADFISLTHDDVALAGAFEVTETTNGAVIEYGKAVAKDDAGLTLHFTSAGTKATFYFSLPVGTIPAGLKLTVGKTSDTDTWMTKTTTKPVTIKRGTVMKVNVEIPYTPVDQQWEAFANAEFIDDFLWGKHSKYTADTKVSVTVERSGLHPNKYRINNPYTVANTQFGYTPHTAGIVADPYLLFYIEDGKVRFMDFKTGIEDSDSGGRPMMITYRPSKASNSYVVDSWEDGSPKELLMGGYFIDPNDASYFYTRDDTGGNAPTIHLYFSEPEWYVVAEGEFIDDLLWPSGYHNWGSTRVPVQLQQNTGNAKQFRVPNPYLAAADFFGYTPYTEGIVGDEYLQITLANEGDGLTFTTFLAGIEDKATGGKPMKIWYPTDYSPAYGVTTYNLVKSWRSDGLPAELQLAARYSQVVNPTAYVYTKDETPTIHLYFPESEETWTSLGTGRYMDEFFWTHNAFPPYLVEVEIWRSDVNANRYRFANPYTQGNTAFKRTAKGTADEYCYFTVDPSTKLVSFDKFVTGMTKGTSTLENRNFALAHPTTWNTLKGTSLSATGVKVSSGTGADPKEVLFTGAYYDSDDNTYFYTNGVGSAHLFFPGAYLAGETWSDYSEGTYVDGTYDGDINGSDKIGTVAVTIQQSSVDSKRFRIANPYRAHVAAEYLCESGIYDEYFYFTCGTVNDLAYSEPFRPGVKMNPSVHPTYELAINHPVNSNLKGWSQGGSDFAYSNVVTKDASGNPTKVRLGLHYYDITGPTPGYCYTRQGSGRADSERIFITFDVSEKAVVTCKQYPLLPAYDNPVEKLSLPSGTLQKLVVRITGVNLSTVTLGLYQSGWMTDSYVAPDGDGVVTFDSFSNATVSADIDLNCRLSSINAGDAIRFEVQEVIVDGVSLPVEQEVQPHFPGIVLNDANNVISVRGDSSEVCKSFRIPAFCTTNDGTLIAAYDVRYDSSTDLQNDIDVGFRRSTDGGKTWEPLKLAMDMGIWGYEAQVAAGTMKAKAANQLNGIGDPCLLVDKNTGDIFCFALWTHGKNNGTRALAFGGAGYDPDSVPQLMMVKSSDDGLTWSEPVNLTRQVKQYDWRVIFQGPGNGITMSDGTLVIANQHQKNSQPLHAGIMYSKDHGLTWHMHKEAHAVTSESCVVEIEPGKLLLSMRDETDSHARRAFVTSNLGRSWTAHASNGQMIEPTCEASMIKIDAADNITGQELIIFSNPHSTSGRNHITIQISTDKAVTWPYKMLIDEGGSLGYTCLTRIDASTIGIVYESSRGNIVFQAIPLTDIIN